MRRVYIVTPLMAILVAAPSFAMGPKKPSVKNPPTVSEASATIGDISNGNSNKAYGGNAEQGQLQGQQQGLVGIQGQLGILDNTVKIYDGDVSTSTKTTQDQDQKTRVDSHDSVQVDASDNSVQTIDNNFPVNTAAPVFAGNCSQGISAQTMSFGGSIASGNPVCDFIAVAGAYIAGGDRTEAFRVLGKAERAADWRFFFAKVRMTLTLGLL